MVLPVEYLSAIGNSVGLIRVISPFLIPIWSLLVGINALIT